MRVIDVFKSKYLKAADLRNKSHDVTIVRVEMGTVNNDGKDEDRPIAILKEFPKGLCLNVTNTITISELHGEEDIDWAGKRITIYPSECDLEGQTVPCIRIRKKLPPVRKAKVTAKPKVRPGR